MTLHTLAIVLKQSVVFSIGRFLFCEKKKRNEVVAFTYLFKRPLLFSRQSLTSDTNFVVPSLNVFSMGVASA